MIKYIYYLFIVTVFVSEVTANLPNYVHLHTMEEIIETNYVLLDKSDVCTSSENSDSGFLIAIKTAPAERDQRSILRQTWLIEVIEHRIPYIFVMGATTDQQLTEELLTEDKTYNDLLIGKPLDNYYNLTLKAAFLLAWAKTYCSTHWLLYVDDDTIINVQKAIDFVASVKNETDRVIYCGIIIGQSVIRSPDSKWYVPISIWDPEYYPPYCSGNGYMIPPDTIFLLHQAAINSSIKPKLWIDDAFITGIVTKAVGIKLIESPLRCCVDGNIELFNESVLLGQMGKGKTLLTVWESLRGNLTFSVKPQAGVFKSMIKISRFNSQGYLITAKVQNSEKLFQFDTDRYDSNLIDYSFSLGIMFLIIMVLLLTKLFSRTLCTNFRGTIPYMI